MLEKVGVPERNRTSDPRFRKGSFRVSDGFRTVHERSHGFAEITGIARRSVLAQA